ncbi:flippase [Granulicella sp. S156]|uniref:flippase n=1 Tax=Granulicella sp. S156 TaxID=1747224 RepID=UPI00131E27A7|nr:flippase [Granulicella sp. S156]
MDKGSNVLDTPGEKFVVLTEGVQDNAVKKLTSGSLLARNSVWNLVGQFAPMAVGLFTIPRLVHALGTDRFGVLMIAWMVVGYFSFFDLGLGRAMTNLVAQKLASDSQDELPAIIWTANLVMGALGIVGASLLALLSPLFVEHLLKIPPPLRTETLQAFYLLSLSVFFVISTAGFRGILEARQRFGIINIVRIPMGVATFLAPLLVLHWSKHLPAVVGILVVMRMTFWFTYVWIALRDMPSIMHRFVIEPRLIPMLLSFGAWMTVSNIISPMMEYLDRFLVGMLLSLTAVAYYATPYDVVTKLVILPAGIMSVLFPAFSTALVADHAHAAKLFRRTVKCIIIVLLPLTVLMVLFARNGLQLWLGPMFASHSTRPLQWLAIGVLGNGLAVVPFALIQGAGRPDITAKLHMLEFPFYVATVWVLTNHFGIVGTAIAWAARVIVDAILLYWVAGRFLDRFARFRSLCIAVLGTMAVFALAMINMSLPTKIFVSAMMLAVFSAITWFVLLSPSERLILQNFRNRLLTTRPGPAPTGA